MSDALNAIHRPQVLISPSTPFAFFPPSLPSSCFTLSRPTRDAQPRLGRNLCSNAFTKFFELRQERHIPIPLRWSLNLFCCGFLQICRAYGATLPATQSHEPRSRGRQSAHFESNESQRRLTSAATALSCATNLCFICVHLWLMFPPDGFRAHPKRFAHAIPTPRRHRARQRAGHGRRGHGQNAYANRPLPALPVRGAAARFARGNSRGHFHRGRRRRNAAAAARAA